MSSSSRDATRASLLGRAILRDEQAWCQLVDLYGPLIAHWCKGFHLDSHRIADIVQDVFLAVSCSIGRFRSPPGAGAFRSWLWKITRHKLVDVLRHHCGPAAEGGSSAQHRLALIPDPMTIPEEEPSDQHALDELTRRAIKQIESEFQPATWAAFWRSAIDGVPTATVAAELGTNSAAVRQARSRILRRLRVYLNENES